MAKWNEQEYVQQAKQIAHRFSTKQGSLNDLSEKVARDECLNPDEIRTLVRLANVATFQQLFSEKQGDKMVEYEVGDPEAVVRRIQDSVASPAQTANIHNDKLASLEEVPDMMIERRLGAKFDEPEKVAAWEDAPERAPRHDLAVICARKHLDELEVAGHKFAQEYETVVDSLARSLRRAPGYGVSVDELEKSAFAEYGEEIRPDMAMLYGYARIDRELPAPEKVATLKVRHVSDETAELSLLGKALEARKNFVKVSEAADVLKKLIPEA